MNEEKIVIPPIIAHKTRQQTMKAKERTESKPKTRLRTSSETVLTNPTSTSPPSSTVPTTRLRTHSPSHMPYPLRSPRTKQHRQASPVPPLTITSGRLKKKNIQIISSLFIRNSFFICPICSSHIQ